MQNKTFMYILILVVIVFLIFDLFTVFNRRPKFDITFYKTVVETDYSDTATITTIAGLSFKDEKSMYEYKESYTNASSKTFLNYFEQISKEIGKTITVLNYENSAKERAGILEIEEIAVLKNLVDVSNNTYTLNMGNIQINPNPNSLFIVYIPKDSILVSSNPTPTSFENNKLSWDGESLKNFPTVIYRRKWWEL